MTIARTAAEIGRRTLGVLLGGAASLALLTGSARAEPALWVVKDADSTIYLFGTVHALKPTTQWRTPKIEAALKDSDELWLEIEDADNPAAMQPLIAKLGMDPAKPLSSRLTEAERKLLTEAAAKTGVPAQAMEPMRPWLAALMLVVAPLVQAGYDPAKGVDNLLKAAAKAEGKPLKTFETAEQQFRFFADLPPEVELEMLRQTLADYQEGAAVVDRIAVAWAAGDTAAIERLMIDDMKKEAPDLYRILIVDRNKAWAERITQRLAGSGDSFVAVGAGHLAGPDSVQALLAARGVKVERR